MGLKLLSKGDEYDLFDVDNCKLFSQINQIKSDVKKHILQKQKSEHFVIELKYNLNKISVFEYLSMNMESINGLDYFKQKDLNREYLFKLSDQFRQDHLWEKDSEYNWKLKNQIY